MKTQERAELTQKSNRKMVSTLALAAVAAVCVSGGLALITPPALCMLAGVCVALSVGIWRMSGE